MKSSLATVFMLVVFLWSNICFAQTSQHPATVKKERPKIAVVLAGGGAKGVAHVPALKAIEDAGIPIDLVVGTSMGSIIGAMYCTGYSPDTMRSIIQGSDWVKIITDNPDYIEGQTVSNKKDDESYLLRYMIDPDRTVSSTRTGGIIGGINVMRFFKNLTRFLPDSLDFSDLPVPFACVGTEAVNGGKKVFTSGNLPTCIRASMAIPTAFTPVTIDSVVYVDGGIVDNYPVDVAREMGADIVIGVDLKVRQTEAQLTNSAFDMLMNCIDHYSRDQYKRNVENTDIYIPVDVTGYNAASFGAAALDTLLHRGDYYVSLKKASLDSLSNVLNLDEEPKRIRIGEYSFANASDNSSNWKNTETKKSLSKANDGSLSSSINIGFRLDNEEYASVKAKLNYVVSQKNAMLLKVQGRLGQRIDFSTDFSIKTIGTQRFGIDYKFQRHDINFLYDTKKAIDCEMRHNRVNLYLSQEWRSIQYTFGLAFHNQNYRDILVDSRFADYLPKSNFTENHFSYFLTAEINSLNSQYFPTIGQQMVLSADLITDNLATYKDDTMLPVESFKWVAALSFGSRFTLQPHLYVRAIFKEESADKPLALFNLVGGFMNQLTFFQQNTMAGMFNVSLIKEDGVGIGGLTAQYMLFKNHYIHLSGDILSHTNNIKYAFNNESLNWGVEASYSYKTPIGPLSAKFYWNDLTDKFNFFINVGYYF